MNSFSKEINEFILTLYQGALETPFTDFKEWFFNFLQNMLSFDSAIWLSRSDMEQPIPKYWVDDTHLFNQPREFMSNYQRLATLPNNVDLLHEKLLNTPNTIVSLWEAYNSRDEWYQTSYYQEHSKIYEIEHMLSTLVLPKHNSNVSHVLSFYRKDIHKPFLENELQTLELLIPHFVEAFRISILNSLTASNDGTYSVKGIVDRFGRVIECEEAFEQSLASKKLLVGKQLQFDVVDSTKPITTKIDDTIVKMQACDGLFVIELQEKNKAEELTEKQKEIAALLSKGYVDKEISRKLDVKLSTVRYHLKNIYEVLGVDSRYAAISYLLHTNSKYA